MNTVVTDSHLMVTQLPLVTGWQWYVSNKQPTPYDPCLSSAQKQTHTPEYVRNHHKNKHARHDVWNINVVLASYTLKYNSCQIPLTKTTHYGRHHVGIAAHKRTAILQFPKEQNMSVILTAPT